MAAWLMGMDHRLPHVFALALAACLTGGCATVSPTHTVAGPGSNTMAQPVEDGSDHVSDSARESATAARRPTPER